MKRALFFAMAVAATSAQASILTFDIAGAGNGTSMHANYGDAVTSTSMGIYGYGVGSEGFTPNVQAGYSPAAADPSHWTTGYGDLTNVLFKDADSFPTLDVLLFADPGFQVVLLGFDMAAYNPSFSSPPTIDSLTVFNGSNQVLWTQTNVTISETSHTTFDFSSAPLVASTIKLQFNSGNLSGLSDDIAFDNIRIGQQPVPEPATLMILGGGLVALSRRHRR